MDNVTISIQICDGDSHKVSQSSAELSSIKIIFLKDQNCKGQRNKEASCLPADTDHSRNYDTALRAERNVTEDFSGIKRAVFGLCIWHPCGSLFKRTEVLDVVELDLSSSEYHAGFLFKYNFFLLKYLITCKDVQIYTHG